MHPMNTASPHQINLRRFPFDIQLFAGEKTEPATDKRREEARESGNIMKSQDLESVIVLIVAFIAIRIYGPDMIGNMGNFMRTILSSSLTTDLTPLNTMQLFYQFLLVNLKCLFPIFSLIAITAITVNIAQVGLLLTFDPLIPDFSRLNPISGIENILSWKSLGELVKSIFKVLIVAYIPYSTLVEQMPMLIRLIQIEPMPGTILLMKILFNMIMKILFVLLVLAMGDWYFQHWRYEENLKMSKEEIKEEYKQREGDPKVKSKIRERQRKLASKKMMAEVPKATVVVTNPTHIAVALQYDAASSLAPKVLAMGTGLIAQKIKDIAKEHHVPVIENKPLAQALHKMVDVGDEIPADLFMAVAEILVQVHRMKNQPA